jgi:hypothetical protein
MGVHHLHTLVSTLEFFQHSFSAKGNDQEGCAMRSTRYSLFVLLTISVLCCFLTAQQTTPSVASSTVVPRLVNFSGKAVDEQGKPISGTAAATFAIYKDQEAGAPLWLETQNVTADKAGHYTAQLGASKPDGLPVDLFSSGDYDTKFYLIVF